MSATLTLDEILISKIEDLLSQSELPECIETLNYFLNKIPDSPIKTYYNIFFEFKQILTANGAHSTLERGFDDLEQNSLEINRMMKLHGKTTDLQERIELEKKINKLESKSLSMKADILQSQSELRIYQERFGSISKETIEKKLKDVNKKMNRFLENLSLKDSVTNEYLRAHCLSSEYVSKLKDNEIAFNLKTQELSEEGLDALKSLSDIKGFSPATYRFARLHDTNNRPLASDKDEEYMQYYLKGIEQGSVACELRVALMYFTYLIENSSKDVKPLPVSLYGYSSAEINDIFTKDELKTFLETGKTSKPIPAPLKGGNEAKWRRIILSGIESADIGTLLQAKACIENILSSARSIYDVYKEDPALSKEQNQELKARFIQQQANFREGLRAVIAIFPSNIAIAIKMKELLNSDQENIKKQINSALEQLDQYFDAKKPSPHKMEETLKKIERLKELSFYDLASRALSMVELEINRLLVNRSSLNDFLKGGILDGAMEKIKNIQDDPGSLLDRMEKLDKILKSLHHEKISLPDGLNAIEDTLKILMKQEKTAHQKPFFTGVFNTFRSKLSGDKATVKSDNHKKLK